MPLLNIFFLYSPPPHAPLQYCFHSEFYFISFQINFTDRRSARSLCGMGKWNHSTIFLHPEAKTERGHMSSIDVGQTFRFGFPPPRESADPLFLCMLYLWLFRLIKKSLENESSFLYTCTKQLINPFQKYLIFTLG